MFGYVTVNQEELKMKEYRRYRGFYCGLCGSLKERYGIRGQAILPYDMVFLDILLNALYEEPLSESDFRCIAHPLTKQHRISNGITDYCADMGLLLAYYKLIDDAADDGSAKAVAMIRLLRKQAHTAAKRHPRQAEAVRRYIRELRACERRDEQDLDRVAGLTGTALDEIFVMREDTWSDILRTMAFFLGKYVYLLDAYDDLAEDAEKGRYNPWRHAADEPGFEERAEETLVMMMSECAKAFEKLPIVQDVEILRNVIYSGVWVKFGQARAKRNAGSAK